jgi:hypothetical protein
MSEYGSIIFKLRAYQQACVRGKKPGRIPYSAGVAADALEAQRATIEAQAAEIVKLREAVEREHRAGQISEDFRKNPASRQWATSYTKSVFDRVGAIRASQLNYPVLEALVAAMALLKDYHESQHIVYEQRDAARAEAEQKNDIHAFLRDVIVASVQSGDRGAAIFALADVDAKRLHDVKPERYLDFIKALLKRTGEATAKKLLEKAIES